MVTHAENIDYEQRPSWVVLAPGDFARVAPIARKIHRRRRGSDPMDWLILSGTKDYTAIVEPEPGSVGCGDEELAVAISKALPRPVYLLWTTDDECECVHAYVDGEYQGDVRAAPDSVAMHLGCSYPAQWYASEIDDADMEVEPPIVRQPGEFLLAGYSIPEWRRMQRDGHAHILLDSATEADIEEILLALSHQDPETRAIACHLVEGLGTYRLGDRLERALTILRATTQRDADETVREQAHTALSTIERHLEHEAISREFPWLDGPARERFDDVLALLDDPRPLVRSEAYSWFWNVREIPSGAKERLTTKLISLLSLETGEEGRDSCEMALERVREATAVAGDGRNGAGYAAPHCRRACCSLTMPSTRSLYARKPVLLGWDK